MFFSIMEVLKHECGIAIVRLLKPIEYYVEKYGTPYYGLNKLYLLMEKQHNRGQEGAGLSCIKMHATPGNEYIYRERAVGAGAIKEIFANVRQSISVSDAEGYEAPYVGEIYLGHLRYSTTGKSGLSYIQPFLRRNNWKARNMLLCGNFNMANVEDIFKHVVSKGQHPRIYSDTFFLLEQLGAELDFQNQMLFNKFKSSCSSDSELTSKIEDNIDLNSILKKSAPLWDGGFVICGATGSGDVFALRDKNGIRPAFYYTDDEICVIASERPVVQTVMNVGISDVTELRPGSSITISKKGEVTITDILGEGKNERCSFERIYFSRGGDCDIYRERKALGEMLAEPILRAIDYDLTNSVLSFIPNTAEVAYLGMIEGLDKYLNGLKADRIAKLNPMQPDYRERIEEILGERIRSEKIAFKDIKLRTFITEGGSRDDLAAHVYDVTYGVVRQGIDNIIVIDDSIVRGTTLKQSIIRMLDRLKPKRIIVVSSSPQVRYPDYYGIDMSSMAEFCAFRAAIQLLKDKGMMSVITDVYHKCVAQIDAPDDKLVNYIKDIYSPFTDEQVSKKIAEMLTPSDCSAEVKLVYQSVEGLHKAIPDNPGDWYFSGNYPTPGGIRMSNKAFIDYYEKFFVKK